MGDKANTTPGAAGRALTADRPASVRNVVLVGHSGSGKTTLVEALAQATGAVNRPGRVEDGGTVSDYDEIEHRQQRSVQLSLVPVGWDGFKINLLDTPGYADFVGELRAGLRAADAALFVVSAAQEADAVAGSTRMVWEECAAVGMPRAIVVTHLDTARTDFTELTAVCADLFGRDDPDAVLPLYLPVRGTEGADGHAPATGLVGLLSERILDYSTGVRREEEPDEGQRELIAEARARLIEGIIAESEDETLMDRYLGGEEIDVKTLVDDLEKAVARGSFHPVLAAAPAIDGGTQGLGTLELLELITGGFPSPLEHEPPAVTTPDGQARPPVTCDPDGPLVAEVVKTAADPYVGRISLVRVFSGTLRPDETVHVSGHGLADRGHEDHDVDERIGGLTSPFGKQQRPMAHCVAGDLACVARLGRAETGDTISAKSDPLLMEPWSMPEPLLPLAVEAHSKADEDRLSQGLARLVAEDPTMRLEQNQDTRQVVLWCLGEAHQDVVLERLRGRYGVQVDAVAYKVSLRETFGGASAGRGRHVKQSGGHGQFAICEIDVEPLPAGSGIEFVDKVVGGAVPRQFIASVEKGIRAQAARGVAAGYPLVDVRVTLRDGKAHSVDSSDAAFQTAGALALREAAADVPVHLLEPVAEVQVLVPDEYVGPVMSDLSGRRGRVVGTEQAGPGRTVVRAEVPEIEISRYAIDLRSVSHGTGRFDRTYARHEPMPPHLADKIREQA
ncbi:Translation elongation factor G-related protein [Streptomyces venezuelae]|uniref:elongation factor G-like protein EF-G2 n=1 Tax=Streptomyces gardneri TaxID=66892 RepID=UPI0006BD27C1|nr:elongation factor G-like protein EF-G2 [Streptomyces gardneri]ALO07116.1 Translation elongation factor G-related protein [Streptomyces venezuelae]QPK44474.1 elongation factor G-like protein EF-G2 [Streptomyces gardneri]WRK35771.1 elongation factor G-like protein EF-G2 [Streptomyces venezuelae]CUM42576.1 Translation elongation factor G-related protein [Streptomyces venezuelae]